MQLRHFVLPVKDFASSEMEMNAFLRSHRVLTVNREFVADGENSFWCFNIEYLDRPKGAVNRSGGKAPKVDYRGLWIKGQAVDKGTGHFLWIQETDRSWPLIQ